jgi:phosphoribosyl-ATP pyrophosphohydrolase
MARNGFLADRRSPVFFRVSVFAVEGWIRWRFYLCHPMSTQPQPSGLIEALDLVLEERKSQDPTQSYVAKLYHKGLPKILEKVEEECRETVEAASEEGTDHLVYEVGDLWFHTLVLLHHKGRSGAEVVAELARRFGVSGLEEKASRPHKEVQQ